MIVHTKNDFFTMGALLQNNLSHSLSTCMSSFEGVASFDGLGSVSTSDSMNSNQFFLRMLLKVYLGRHLVAVPYSCSFHEQKKNQLLKELSFLCIRECNSSKPCEHEI